MIARNRRLSYPSQHPARPLNELAEVDSRPGSTSCASRILTERLHWQNVTTWCSVQLTALAAPRHFPSAASTAPPKPSCAECTLCTRTQHPSRQLSFQCAIRPLQTSHSPNLRVPLGRDEHLAQGGALPQHDAQLACVRGDELKVGQGGKVVVEVSCARRSASARSAMSAKAERRAAHLRSTVHAALLSATAEFGPLPLWATPRVRLREWRRRAFADELES